MSYSSLSRLILDQLRGPGYREYGTSDETLGLVFFVGGGFLEITSDLHLLPVDHPVASGAGRWS